MLVGYSWEELAKRCSRRKKAFEEKEFKVKVGKIRAFCTGERDSNAEIGEQVPKCNL